jgi:hypothetical protein
VKLATLWSTHSNSPESMDRLIFFFGLRGMGDYGCAYTLRVVATLSYYKLFNTTKYDKHLADRNATKPFRNTHQRNRHDQKAATTTVQELHEPRGIHRFCERPTR